MRLAPSQRRRRRRRKENLHLWDQVRGEEKCFFLKKSCCCCRCKWSVVSCTVGISPHLTNFAAPAPKRNPGVMESPWTGSLKNLKNKVYSVKSTTLLFCLSICKEFLSSSWQLNFRQKKSLFFFVTCCVRLHPALSTSLPARSNLSGNNGSPTKPRSGNTP